MTIGKKEAKDLSVLHLTSANPYDLWFTIYDLEPGFVITI